MQGEMGSPRMAAAMYQERETTDGEVAVANRHDQPRIVDTEISAQPEVKPLRLHWMGPRAFKARYGVQPGVDRDFGMWGGHDTTNVSPTVETRWTPRRGCSTPTT